MTFAASKKRLVFPLILVLVPLLTLELVLRILFSCYVGPSVLLYGTPFDRNNVQVAAERGAVEPEAKTFLDHMTLEEWRKRRTVVAHQNELGGYSKYFPGQNRVDFDVETGERFSITINNHGFRGRDFSDKKAPGVIRVICLGASSTFGYFDRDDETYPYYLEQLLNNHFQGEKKFEVINFGIPHLTSSQIYNLFVNEGLPLESDIVTFYEGNNDTEPPKEWLDKSLFYAGLRKAGQYSILFKLVDSVFNKYFMSLHQSTDDRAVSAINRNFIKQISKIDQECKQRKIQFVLANQQKNSQSFARSALKGLTYREEVAKIQGKLKRSGGLSHPEMQLLIHSVLMNSLADWADRNQVPFVDAIGRLDHDRDVLVSWVHLSPKGNRMVAEAFGEEIIELLSDSGSGGPDNSPDPAGN